MCLSKMVHYDRLRTCDVNNNYNANNYKNVTVLFSKIVLKNHLKIAAIECYNCSSACTTNFLQNSNHIHTKIVNKILYIELGL